MEQTLSIIKPDAVEKKCIGEIIAMFEAAGLRVAAAKMIHLTQEEAETFYAVHKGKHFFESVIQFMISGPVLVMVLEGENAIRKNRDLMGATNPKNAEPGTIRATFCQNVGDRLERNAVHGSDAPETAQEEISFFFGVRELVNSCSSKL